MAEKDQILTLELLRNDPELRAKEKARSQRDCELIFGVIPRNDTVPHTDSVDRDTAKP